MKKIITIIFAALAASVPAINYAIVVSLPAPVIRVPLEDSNRYDVPLTNTGFPAEDLPVFDARPDVNKRRIVVGYKVDQQKAEAKYVDAKDFKDKVIVVETPSPTPLPLPPVPIIPQIPVVSP